MSQPGVRIRNHRDRRGSNVVTGHLRAVRPPLNSPFMRRSTSAQRRKVQEAKRLVQLALGDAVRPDHPKVEKFGPIATAKPAEPLDESVLVLSPGEVAARLNIGRDEVERMIRAGKIRALITGWTVMVPTSEVARVLGRA